MKNWTEEAILSLIDGYERFEFMYDIKSEDYHNRHKRRDALDVVVLNVLPFRPNTTVEDVKAKWNCLRTQFSNELQKIREKPSGSAMEDSTWWCFQKLLFLRDHVAVRKSTSSMLLPITSFGEAEDNAEELETSQVDPEPEVIAVAAAPKGRKRRVATDDSNDIPNFLQAASGVLQSINVKRDELDDFGAFVVSSLRAMSNKRIRNELQKRIMLNIFELKNEDLE